MNLVGGYALWLIPERAIYQEIQGLISPLQASVGQPVFNPHITLISGLNLREDEIINRAKILAENHSVVTVAIERAVWGYTFFQRYFYTLKSVDKLLALHKDALQIFGETDSGKYRPHISLEYADHTQIPDESIQNNVRSMYGISVKLTDLLVVKTTGSIEEWETLVTCSLQKEKEPI